MSNENSSHASNQLDNVEDAREGDANGEENVGMRAMSKSSLSFILDQSSSSTSSSPEEKIPKGQEIKQNIPIPIETTRSQVPVKRPIPMETTQVPVKRHRPPSRICKADGCQQYVVDQGLCVRHGGGKRCEIEGCTSRAKYHGLCWKHGGSMECKTRGCTNRAKSRGYCWSHGGGTKCKATTSCETIAISNGLCWAHGGGKRCLIEHCNRQAYERTENYCNHHFSLFQAKTKIKQEEEKE